MTTIYCDIDGVLADFVRAFSRAGGFDHEAILRDWPKGEYVIMRAYRITLQRYSDIFSCIDWLDIDKTAECDAILEVLKGHDVCFVSRELYLDRQKRETWLHCVTGKKAEILWDRSPQERAQNAPGNLLIDDCDANVAAWVANGGRAIMIPRPWNTATTEFSAWAFSALIE